MIHFSYRDIAFACTTDSVTLHQWSLEKRECREDNNPFSTERRIISVIPKLRAVKGDNNDEKVTGVKVSINGTLRENCL